MTNQYFQDLNYTLANEDTALEVAILPENAKHVVSVAGSGGRVLPLLSRFPERLTCVDVSKEQLALTELRIESVRALSHEDFVAFWGYPPKAMTPERRQECFEKINLTSGSQEFLRKYFEKRNWGSILYDGKWEKTFARLSRVNRSITGAKGLGLFTALTPEEHTAYLKKKFPRKAWFLVIFLLGNATVFNALLYKGHFPKKNISRSFIRFYLDAFDRLFKQGPARQNFFMQLLFFGRVLFAEGCPIECEKEIFEKCKSALAKTKVEYVRGDLMKVVQESDQDIDFLSFSDVPSYFSGDTEKNFMQRVRPKLSKDGTVVVRNYLHVPKDVDTTGFDLVSDQYKSAIDAEKVQVYLVDVYRRRQ
ncbi:DUF3419 family protein [bacterium]|jgi:S-adenosylmethionine-diacylglycerol 3-amino-3-carboxypropyl transferase|nr:DUF3419 family protein [bacterium]